jgi:hypothetical protein
MKNVFTNYKGAKDMQNFTHETMRKLEKKKLEKIDCKK